VTTSAPPATRDHEQDAATMSTNRLPRAGNARLVLHNRRERRLVFMLF
jgi:hypothetical protein